MTFHEPALSVANGSTAMTSSRFRSALDFLSRSWRWLLIVVLPTVLLSIYYWVIASPQYESEAHILVRGSQSNNAGAGGLGQALGMLSSSSSSPDNMSVGDYLASHDAVETLRQKYGLVDRYRRDGTDFISKLSPADPTPERLLRYFRQHADVKVDSDTGILNIRVRSFRPSDSFQLVNALIELGEQRVNLLNQRMFDSSLDMARRQLKEAEDNVSRSSSALTAFRQRKRDIDPVAVGQAHIEMVSSLQSSLAQARAQQLAMAGSIRSDSPVAKAQAARVAALTAQVASEQGQLTGNHTAIAANVGDYQDLQLRQQFAAKRYDEAAASLERARSQAEKQQLFVVRVVNANMPVKATYPQGLKTIVTTLVTLTLCYAIGWLIAAGVREHTA